MKRFFIFLFLFSFIFPSIVLAGQPLVKLRWDYNFKHDPDVHKFRLYKNGHQYKDITAYRVIQEPGSDNITTLGYDVICPDCYGRVKWEMTAIDDAGQESEKSNSAYSDSVPEPPAEVRAIVIFD